jgi:hypothetical protein
MTIRVTRLMQYTYPDITTATQDMMRWTVPSNGSKVFGNKVVSSAVMPVDLLHPQDQDFDGDTADHIPGVSDG